MADSRTILDRHSAMALDAAVSYTPVVLAAGPCQAGKTTLRLRMAEPLRGQEAITRFLEHETARIDGLVAKVRDAITFSRNTAPPSSPPR